MKKLSEKEIRFLCDTDFLLTKQEINRKISALLGEAEQKLKSVIKASDFPFPNQTFLKAAKISRGEQYRGLPYWVLDYPRKFSKEATFSFRTLIWWGHEISCFLHLGGTDLEKFRPLILENLRSDPDQFIAVNSSPWEYHFEADNYKRVTEIDPQALDKHMSTHHFHKMIYQLPLEDLGNLPDFASHTFAKIISKLH